MGIEDPIKDVELEVDMVDDAEVEMAFITEADAERVSVATASLEDIVVEVATLVEERVEVGDTLLATELELLLRESLSTSPLSEATMTDGSGVKTRVTLRAIE